MPINEWGIVRTAPLGASSGTNQPATFDASGALVVIDLYNRTPGRKILVSTRTFGKTSRNARSATKAAS